MVQLMSTYSVSNFYTLTFVFLAVVPCFCLIPAQRRWTSAEDLPEMNVIEVNDQRPILLLPQGKLQELQQQPEVPRRLPFFSTFNLSPDERSKRAERLCGVRLLKRLDLVCKKCSKRPETEPVPNKRSALPFEKGKNLSIFPHKRRYNFGRQIRKTKEPLRTCGDLLSQRVKELCEACPLKGQTFVSKRAGTIKIVDMCCHHPCYNITIVEKFCNCKPWL
ncbi:hypothetical protein FO519_008474 [Halicephalobus sp. NKZ332]|nr:hypothetical protein FO519_008474 [Halicephalobus sp. NKZ332]